MHSHQLFGLVVASSRALPAASTHGAADLTITEHHGRLPGLPANERGYAYVRRPDGSIHVSWSDLFDFVVSADGSHIAVHADGMTGHEATYTYLLSQVISVALLNKNIESLHGSAIEYEGRGYVFLGDCGEGKSTLTAALVRAGARLITDDLVVITAAHELAPGAHRIKLHPNTAELLGLPWPGVAMADGSGKHVLRLPAERCVTNHVPLHRMFLVTPHAARLEVESISSNAATRALLAATFNPLRTDAARLSRLLTNAQQLASAVPVHRLHVPRDLAQLQHVLPTIQQ